MAAIVTKCIPTKRHKKLAYGSYPVQVLLLMRDENEAVVVSAASKPSSSAAASAGPKPAAAASSTTPAPGPAKGGAAASSPSPAITPAPSPAPASAPASPTASQPDRRSSLLERFKQSITPPPESSELGFELVDARLTLSVQEPAIHLQLPRLSPALRHFKVSRSFFRGGFPYQGAHHYHLFCSDSDYIHR